MTKEYPQVSQDSEFKELPEEFITTLQQKYAEYDKVVTARRQLDEFRTTMSCLLY
jgi:hypothetical protein